MSLRKEAVNGVVWSAAQKWGIRVITFFVTLILARLLTPDSFGLVAYATVFFNFASIFVDAGFSDAVVQFANLDRDHLDTAFWVSVFTGTLLTFGTFFAADRIALLFHEPRLGLIIKWLSPSFLGGSLSSIQGALLRRKLAFKALTIRSLISVVVSGIVGVTMAFMGFGVWSLVARALVGGAVSVITLWQVSDWRPSFHISWSHLKELFSFGINIVGGDFVDFLSTNADNFLIGYYLGSELLGYYSLAYNLLIMLTDLLVTVPNIVSFPIFSRIQKEPERLKSAFYEVTQLQSFMAFPVFLGILAVAPEAVRVLYSDKWIATIPVLQVLMLSGITRSATYFYSSIFRASGKPSWRFAIYTLTAILNVIGFLLTVRMGIVAVGMSYVVVSYALMPLYFFLIQKLVRIKLSSHLGQYAPAFISSFVMVCVVIASRYVLGASLPLILRLAVLVIAGGATYLIGIDAVKPALFGKVIGLVKLALPKLQARQN